MGEIAIMNERIPPPSADGPSDEFPHGASPSLENILSLDNVAETFGVSRWLLRYCEFRGLIRRRNRIGSTWVYSWADCDRIAFIIKCRRAGLQFSEIAPIVRAADDDSARVHEGGQEQCMALVERLEKHRRAIDEALAELGHTHALLGAKWVSSDEGGGR